MLVAKKEKREQAMGVFDKLLQTLPSLELYRVALPSPRIKRQLVQTYVDILTLIVCVTEWCAIGRLCMYLTFRHQGFHADGHNSKTCRCAGAETKI